MNIETTYDLERHLAVARIKHNLNGQQLAIAHGDHGECHRYTKLLDHLVLEYGVSALIEAQGEYIQEKHQDV